MIRLTDYFITACISEPSFSEGLTNDPTALGMCHLSLQGIPSWYL